MATDVIVATIMRPKGETGVQTHFRHYLAWLEHSQHKGTLLTPFNAPAWQVYPVFAVRTLLDPLDGTASVRWYRHWHAKFLERTLRERLADANPCVVLAQCPLSAAAAL